jgi:dGTPase
VIDTATTSGGIGMHSPLAETLDAFRSFNYEHIYLRPASPNQAQLVTEVVRALVELYADRPNMLPHRQAAGVRAGSHDALHRAVGYVAGMTDRFAVRCAVSQLGWDASKLQAFSPG